MSESKLKKLEILSIASVILILFIISRYFAWEKSKVYDELDEARKEYHDEVVGYDPYEKGFNKYVKNVKVVDLFEDREYSGMLFYTNHDKVTICMQDGFDWLPVKERCAICAEVMDEIRPEMNRYFKKSRFYRMYTENKGGMYMKYRDKYLDLSYKCDFEFLTSGYEYTFPLYGNMTVTASKTRTTQHYEYGYMDGKLWRFEDKNSLKKSEEKKTESTGSSSSGTYKKSSKSTYDPYDAKKYNSAQDFADDKYEEFYDYEDDYEDEDEAYDAAEDYWYDNY